MKDISRRKFTQYVGLGSLALAGSMTLSIAGCNALDDLEKWIPVGLASFQSILNLLEASGIISVAAGGPIAAMVAVIQAGFANLTQDIETYKKITPPPVGSLQKIEAGLNLIIANFQSFLTTINIPDSRLATLVAGLAGVILSTLAGFGASMPSSTMSLVMKSVAVGGKQPVSVTPSKQSVRQFKKEWNKLMSDSGYPQHKLHLSLLESI